MGGAYATFPRGHRGEKGRGQITRNDSSALPFTFLEVESHFKYPQASTLNFKVSVNMLGDLWQLL
jgi:hypothetical protein